MMIIHKPYIKLHSNCFTIKLFRDIKTSLGNCAEEYKSFNNSKIEVVRSDIYTL